MVLKVEGLSNDSVVDAMCIWEALLEDEMTCDKNKVESVYTLKRDAIGAYAMRQLVLDVLLNPVRVGWSVIHNDFNDAFDWEYIPAFLAKAAKYFEGEANWSINNEQAEQIAKSIMNENL